MPISGFTRSLVKLLDTYPGETNEEVIPANTAAPFCGSGWLPTPGASHANGYHDVPGYCHNESSTYTDAFPDCPNPGSFPTGSRLHGDLKETDTWSY
jgi:hypothetical protein